MALSQSFLDEQEKRRKAKAKAGANAFQTQSQSTGKPGDAYNQAFTRTTPPAQAPISMPQAPQQQAPSMPQDFNQGAAGVIGSIGGGALQAWNAATAGVGNLFTQGLSGAGNLAQGAFSTVYNAPGAASNWAQQTFGLGKSFLESPEEAEKTRSWVKSLQDDAVWKHQQAGQQQIIQGASQVMPWSIGIGSAMKAGEQMDITKPLVGGIQGAMEGGQNLIAEGAELAMKGLTGREGFGEAWKQDVSPVLGDVAGILGLKSVRSIAKSSPALSSITRGLDYVDSIGLKPVGWTAKVVNNVGGGLLGKIISPAAGRAMGGTFTDIVRNLSKNGVTPDSPFAKMGEAVETNPFLKNTFGRMGALMGGATNTAQRAKQWMDAQITGFQMKKYGANNIQDTDAQGIVQNANARGAFSQSINQTLHTVGQMEQTLKANLDAIAKQKDTPLGEAMKSVRQSVEGLRQSFYKALTPDVQNLPSYRTKTGEIIKAYVGDLDDIAFRNEVGDTLKKFTRGIGMNASVGYMTNSLQKVQELASDPKWKQYRPMLTALSKAIQDDVNGTLSDVDPSFAQGIQQIQEIQDGRLEDYLQTARDEFMASYRERGKTGARDFAEKMSGSMDYSTFQKWFQRGSEEFQSMFGSLGKVAEDIGGRIMGSEMPKMAGDPRTWFEEGDPLATYATDTSKSIGAKLAGPTFQTKIHAMLVRTGLKIPNDIGEGAMGQAIAKAVQGDEYAQALVAETLHMKNEHLDMIVDAPSTVLQGMEEIADALNKNLGKESLSQRDIDSMPQMVLGRKVVTQFGQLENRRKAVGRLMGELQQENGVSMIDGAQVGKELMDSLASTFGFRVEQANGKNTFIGTSRVEGGTDSWSVLDTKKKKIAQKMYGELEKMSASGQISREAYETYVKNFDELLSDKIFETDMKGTTGIATELESFRKTAEAKIYDVDTSTWDPVSKQLYEDATKEYRQIRDVQNMSASALFPGATLTQKKEKMQNLSNEFSDQGLNARAYLLLKKFRTGGVGQAFDTIGQMGRILQKSGDIQTATGLSDLNDYYRIVGKELFKDDFLVETFGGQNYNSSFDDVNKTAFSTSRSGIIQSMWDAAMNPSDATRIKGAYAFTKTRGEYLRRQADAFDQVKQEQNMPEDPTGNTIQSDDTYQPDSLDASQMNSMMDEDARQQ